MFARVSALGRARKVGGVKEPPRMFILCQNSHFLIRTPPPVQGRDDMRDLYWRWRAT